MSVNQTQSLNQALTYLTLAQQLSNLTSTNTTQNSLSSLLGYNPYSSYDSSPLLSGLYGGSSSNGSFFQNLMQMMFMSSIIKIFQQLLGGLTSQTTAASDCADAACQASASDCTDAACQAPAEETTTSTPSTETHTPREVVTLTSDNAESDLRKQSGTSYVVVCGSGCGRCKQFEPVLESVNNTLGSNATFYSLNYGEQKDLFKTLKKESGANMNMSYGFPIVIKMVDGKATDFYSYSDIKNIYTDESKMTEWFSSKI
ncbi:hypothetical protein IJS77_02520 [bacterium]|nr:hypothetical protein [bacterium]